MFYLFERLKRAFRIRFLPTSTTVYYNYVSYFGLVVFIVIFHSFFIAIHSLFKYIFQLEKVQNILFKEYSVIVKKIA